MLPLHFLIDVEGRAGVFSMPASYERGTPVVWLDESIQKTSILAERVSCLHSTLPRAWFDCCSTRGLDRPKVAGRAGQSA